MSSLVVIPARGGSKRIYKKSIVEFLGSPILKYTLDALSEAGCFDEIHVSTDDQEIADVVKNMGYSIPFMRTAELADDFTPVLEVLKWVVNKYQSRGQNFDTIMMVMPCSPLITADDYRQAIQVFENSSNDLPVLSVCRYPVPPEWALVETSKSTEISFISVEDAQKRSQDLTPKYYDTGNFSIFSKKYLDNYKGCIADKFLKYELPRHKVVDIDEIEDLEFAQQLFRVSRGMYEIE